jgi:hypothetical protein
MRSAITIAGRAPVASDAIVRALGETLFADPEDKVYAVLDAAASDTMLADLYKLKPKFECLYRGDLTPDMAWVAPYLVRLEPGSALTRLVFESGWGKNWGIFATTLAEFDDVRRHFRRFLMVHTSEGKPLHFRYYDPRVMREFFPIADAEQIQTMFGPLKAWFGEGAAENEMLRFEPRKGAAVKKVVDLAKVVVRR